MRWVVWAVVAVLVCLGRALPMGDAEDAGGGSEVRECGQELRQIRIFPRDLAMLQKRIDKVDFTSIDPDVLLMFSYQVITDKKITGATKGRHSFIVVVNATGHIVGASRWNMRLWTPKLLNCSTVYMLSTTTDTHEDYRSNARFTMWNSETGRQVRVPIKGATHDLHYDPGRRTLFWLKNLMLSNPCQYPNALCPDRKLESGSFKSDDIIRSKLNGQVLWRWNTVDQLLRSNATFSAPFAFGDQCDTDFAHMNTIIHSEEQSAVYWNSRTLHSFFKVAVPSGRILWSVGRFSTLTLYDEAGNEAKELFHNAHGLHPIGDSSFLLFDNLHKGPCGDHSRLLRIHVDEAARTARIAWVWAPSDPFQCQQLYRNYGGGSFHLPSGHVVGTFGDRPQHYIVGVSAAGKTEFSMGVRQAFVYDAILFYRRPLPRGVVDHGDTVSLDAYDAFYAVRATNATLEVVGLCGAAFRRSRPVVFLPFWQATPLTVATPTGSGFELRLTNADGVTATHRVPRNCAP